MEIFPSLWCCRAAENRSGLVWFSFEVWGGCLESEEVTGILFRVFV